MNKDSWQPDQYEKFKSQRSEPFYDLVSLLKEVNAPSIVDLGCGTGELTLGLSKTMNAKSVLGIDSSESMLAKAQSFQTDKVQFQLDNIETWKPRSHVDIVFSNAALQWCRNHRELFKNITEYLAPHGQLAVQMPMNHDYPTHTIADKMSKDPYWSNILKNENRDRGQTLLSLEEYATLLFELGYKEQKVQVRVYGHELESREGVIEWVKGTLLTYYKSRMSEDDYGKFLKEYKERLFSVVPDKRPFFYPFKRILIWGRR